MHQLIHFLLAIVLVSVAAAQVNRRTLDCICKIESGCRALGCHDDGGSLSCGYYQIKKAYYIDCGRPGRRNGESTDSAWKRCSKNKGCSEKCVQAYMRRYGKSCCRCSSPSNQVFARVHNGGPLGCRYASTLGYWRKVQSCLNSG